MNPDGLRERFNNNGDINSGHKRKDEDDEPLEDLDGDLAQLYTCPICLDVLFGPPSFLSFISSNLIIF
jgi:hypothetical protein